MEVELTLGLTAIIDEQDAETVAQHLWHAKAGKWTYYARAWINGECVYMHRLIMLGNIESEMFVDHINGKGYDNRRRNLRLVTASQNNYNRHQHQKCEFIGVREKDGRWQYYDYGVKMFIGKYHHALQAAMAHDYSAKECGVDRLNFPADDVRQERSYPSVPEIL